MNVLDFWKRLTKKGLPENMLLEEFKLFQDVWNYFPHRCLGGVSPVELFAKISREKQRKP